MLIHYNQDVGLLKRNKGFILFTFFLQTTHELFIKKKNNNPILCNYVIV